MRGCLSRAPTAILLFILFRQLISGLYIAKQSLGHVTMFCGMNDAGDQPVESHHFRRRHLIPPEFAGDSSSRHLGTPTIVVGHLGSCTAFFGVYTATQHMDRHERIRSSARTSTLGSCLKMMENSVLPSRNPVSEPRQRFKDRII